MYICWKCMRLLADSDLVLVATHRDREIPSANLHRHQSACPHCRSYDDLLDFSRETVRSLVDEAYGHREVPRRKAAAELLWELIDGDYSLPDPGGARAAA